MRKTLFALLVLLSEITYSYDCNKIYVEFIAIDPATPGFMNVAIYNLDTAGTAINYPIVHVTNASGDTIAGDGQPNLFVHPLGLTIHSIPTVLAGIPDHFTGNVHIKGGFETNPSCVIAVSYKREICISAIELDSNHPGNMKLTVEHDNITVGVLPNIYVTDVFENVYAGNPNTRFITGQTTGNKTYYSIPTTLTSIPPNFKALVFIIENGIFRVPGDKFFSVFNYPSPCAPLVIETIENATKKLIICPNPVQDQLNVFLKKPGGTATIHDATGRLISTCVMTTNQLNISCEHFEKGVYFLTIDGENGHQTGTFQVQ